MGFDTFESEAKKYQECRKSFWNRSHSGRINVVSHYYRKKLSEIYRNNIPENSKILELGCGTGNLLASLKPLRGVGVDFSSEAIDKARKRYPDLEFILSDASKVDLSDENFDYIVISNLINDAWDVQILLAEIHRFCSPKTRIVLDFYSHLWNVPLRIMRKVGVISPSLPQNWLTKHDVENFLEISGFQLLKKCEEIILPIKVGYFSDFVNRYLAKIFPFYLFAITNFAVARPLIFHRNKQPSLSIIIAARNESGHIDELISRIPKINDDTEIIFVEGNSTDDTYKSIQRAITTHKDKNIKLINQVGNGKGDAVRTGFESANGEVLIILDADITVPPEDLKRFYDLIARNEAEFVNGVRLVYPMEESAMRFLNLVGNKFFSFAFSWLLGQKIRDTLCGTKALRKSDYLTIKENRSYFGNFDPFGDFDLLFGAARLNLKIVEVPIRYRARRYGETNISRWKHGWLLLRMVVFAARKIKFI